MARKFLFAQLGMAMLLGIALTTLADEGDKNDRERTIEVDTRSVYDAPQRPLDPRIDPERITESEPPPLPELVVLPMPPEHRLSTSADEVPIGEETWRKAMEAIELGLTYLRETQDEHGAWMHETRAVPTDQPDEPSPIGVAVTALAVRGFVQSGGHEAMQSDVVQNALRYIRRSQRDDGSFEGGALTNYVTSSVVSALAALEDPRYENNIREAVRWLQSNQWMQDQGVSPEQDWFGGAGYGAQGRPDMSNTQMMLDALYDAGLSPDEPAFQKALAFVSRAQNLRETNASEWAGDDGGFIYTPAGGGESFSSEAAGEGRFGERMPEGQPRSLRSYGSMTYAGFKSMIYSGLSVNDIRVRAAFDWVRRNFTFEENPGMGPQGLYYYYHTMARALRVAQQDIITDVDGEQHNWREALIEAIVERQREDGSWQNVADRWLEGHDEMATVYAVLSLQEAIKPITMMD
jgi:squalene-hopene/tetraprenyl-beta-curcumene cyclase